MKRTFFARICCLLIVAFLILPLCSFSGIGSQSYTLSVGDTKYLYLQTSEAVHTATWYSTHPSYVSVSMPSDVSCKITVNAYTSSTVTIRCDFKYWVGSGSYKYLMSGAADYYITIQGGNSGGGSGSGGGGAVVQSVTVYFDANGGTLSGNSSKTVTYGYTYGTLPSASKPCATFNGWYTSSGTPITSGSSVNFSYNHTLYANYTSNHSFGSYVTTRNADCTQTGSKTRTCSACGYKETSTIPALEHLYANPQVVKEPTCDQAGETISTCVRCNGQKTSTTAAWGHIWNTGTVSTPAGCTTQGVISATCGRCQTKKNITAEALGHTYDSDCDTSCNKCGEIRTAPHSADAAAYIYDRDDSHIYICQHCDQEFRETHSYDYSTVTLAPTKAKEGIRVYHCACGKTYKESIPCLPHQSDSQVWDGTVATGFACGDGSQGNPFIIETPQQLAFLAQEVNSGKTFEGQYIQLANNIILNNETFTFDPDTGLVKVTDGVHTAYLGTRAMGDDSGTNTLFDTHLTASHAGTWYSSDTSTEEGTYSGTLHEWTPIGTYIGPNPCCFMGTFDGGGYCVKGMYLNNSNGALFDNVGEENSTCWAIIQNLGVENSFIAEEDCSHVAAIAGMVFHSKISHCYSDAIVAGSDHAGIVYCANASEITYCYNSGPVVGCDEGAGICHSLVVNSVISHCYNTGLVIGDAGIVYWLNTSKVSDCYNTGTVRGGYTSDTCSGIVARGRDSTIERCYNLGSIDASRCLSYAAMNWYDRVVYAGGVCGDTYRGANFSMTLSNCFSLNSSIKNSNGTLGGLVARQHDGVSSSSSVYYGYYNSTNKQLNDTQAVDASSYTTFDFTSVWEMGAIEGYPYPTLRCSHAYKVVSVQQASCTGNGSLSCVCALCDHAYTETVNGGHLYENDIDPDCNRCKATRQINGYHTTHDWTATEDNAAATHLTRGRMVSVCTVCQMEKLTYSPKLTTHSFSAWAWSDENSHQRKCACGTVQTVAHNMKNSIITEADHVNTGVAANQCTDCGYKSYTVVSAIPHNFTQENTAQTYLAAEATCTKSAQYYYSCQCGASSNSTFSYGKPLGHSFGSYVSNRDATCQKNETETAVCSGCGMKDTREKANTLVDHVWTRTWTALEAGHYDVCKTCGIAGELQDHVTDNQMTCTACGYTIPPSVNESETDTEVGSESESNSESEADTEVGSESESNSEGEADTEVGSESESNSESEADTEVGSESESNSESEADTEVGSEIESNIESEADTEVGSEIESNIESEADTETDGESEADTGSETESVTEEPKGGCGSSVVGGVGAFVVAAAAAAAVALKKKKED